MLLYLKSLHTVVRMQQVLETFSIKTPSPKLCHLPPIPPLSYLCFERLFHSSPNLLPMASSSSSPFISPSFLLFQQKLFPPIQTCYSWPLHPYLPFVFPSFSSILVLLVSVWIFKSQITANPQLPLPTVHLAFNCRVLLVQKKFQIRIWTSKKFDLVGFLLHRPRWCLFRHCIPSDLLSPS